MLLRFLRRLFAWFNTPTPPYRPRFAPGDTVAFNGQHNSYEAIVIGFEPGKIALRITKKGGPTILGAQVGSTVVLNDKRPEWDTILSITPCS